jgi:hypothetical protein
VVIIIAVVLIVIVAVVDDIPEVVGYYEPATRVKIARRRNSLNWRRG